MDANILHNNIISIIFTKNLIMLPKQESFLYNLLLFCLHNNINVHNHINRSSPLVFY